MATGKTKSGGRGARRTRHNYDRKLMRLPTGKVPCCGLTIVDVVHDGWCDVFRGGYCNCDPDVRINGVPVAGRGGGH